MQDTPPAPPKLEVSIKTPGRIARWIYRLITWFKGASWQGRAAFIFSTAVFLILIVAFVFLGYLSYKSVTGEDLSLFLEVNETVKLSHGEQEALSITLSTRNLAFCTAVCEWSVIDQQNGATVANGTEQIHRTQNIVRSVNISAPISGRITKPYQTFVSCTNTVTRFCKSAGLTRRASAITMASITDTPAESSARSQLSRLPSIANDTSLLLGNLDAIAQTRYKDLQTTAITEADFIRKQYVRLADAVNQDRVIAAAELLRFPQTTSVEAYNMRAAEEQNISLLYSSIDLSEISALLSILPFDEHAILSSALKEARDAIESGTLDEQKTALNTLKTLQSNFVNEKVMINASASKARKLLQEELTAMCTIKDVTCPQNQSVPKTFADTVAQLSNNCDALSKLNETFAQASAAYDQSRPGKNHSATREQAGFSNLEADILLAARLGKLLNVSEDVLGAVELVPSTQTIAFLNNCSVRNESATLPTLYAPLPPLTAQPAELPSINAVEPLCCNLGSCVVCAKTTQIPIIFVHGHSFVESTSPEDNLNAFTAFATRLQQDGVLYAGHVFPREDLTGVNAEEYSELPGDVSFTATYYYDSYPEGGSTVFVIRKSQSIEAYSLRLREAINVVKHKTGQDKVILIAHSMGGLVARRYLQIFGDSDVAGLIMIATPNAGVSGKTQTICPLFGGKQECADMSAGSPFMSKLNGGVQPSIPLYTIAGSGCDNKQYDGVVDVSSVQMLQAHNTLVKGNCTGSQLLHSTLLNPSLYPEVYDNVRAIIAELES